MNFLFLREPPDDKPENRYVVAAHSKEFAIDLARVSEAELQRAQTRLNEVVEKHPSDSWDDEKMVAAAETNLDDTEARLRHALAKRRWEMDDKWKLLIARTAASIAHTKALLLRIDWTRIRSPKQ